MWIIELCYAVYPQEAFTITNRLLDECIVLFYKKQAYEATASP